jgi:hypothetical protein
MPAMKRCAAALFAAALGVAAVTAQASRAAAAPQSVGTTTHGHASGARPSSGAASASGPQAWGKDDAFSHSEAAASEDGRAPAGPKPVQLSRAGLRIRIDPRSGALFELTDLGANRSLTGGGPTALWELEFRTSTNLHILRPGQAKSFRCERVGRGRAQQLRLVWGDFNLPAAPALRIEASVELDDKLPLSRWGIRLDGLSDLAPDRLHFPRLLKLPRQEEELLAVPVWLGQQTAEARKLVSAAGGRRLEWAYPGLLSLQCLAFYQPGGPGLYLACDDTAAFRKTFAFFGDDQGEAGCEVVHVPENRDRQTGRWTLPYHVMAGAFTGDWITAAERYRAWATNQAWATESRLSRRAVPEWVLNTGAWVWNRGPSAGVVPPALALERRLDLPVSVFWHWWHGCSYDTGFPEYLPPREGTAPFEAALRAAHAKDVHALVYMNQRLWGMTTRSWAEEEAERFAVKGPDGKVSPEVYNTFTKAPCASMCMGTDFWRNKYAGLAERAVIELGVDGIYMDQACTSLACYDPTHGHPVGGGTYWMNGFRLLAQDIRRRCTAESRAGSRAPVVLAGEGCGEAWLPYLDLMLSLQVSKERYLAQDGWEVIPFFQAVYHAYGMTYGNYSSLTMPPYDELWPAEFAPKEPLHLLDRKFSRQFLLEQARAFIWGQQPTIANFLPSQLEQRPAEIEYFMRLARIRHQAARYLLYGTLLRPPELHAPSATLDMSRLSIYAGQQGGLTAFQKESPLALAGAWRAPNGDVAFALASIADEPMSLPLNLDVKYYRLPSRARLLRTDESGRKEFGRLRRGTLPLQVSLPARGACLIEFAVE